MGSEAIRQSLARKFVNRWGGSIRDVFNSFLRKYSLIGDPDVFDPRDFSWVAPLEVDWKVIRDEAMSVMAERDALPPIAEISPDHERLGRDRKWKTYFIWGYGYRVDAHCRRCPETARLVEQVPGLITAMYSVHEPGAHLPHHRGVTKAFITAHLALQVPQPREACRIAVEGKDYFWEEGRFFVFDDTYNHEVWNDTDEPRVILLLHVKRPMRWPGSWVRDGFLWGIRKSPFVQEARESILKWVEEHERAA